MWRQSSLLSQVLLPQNMQLDQLQLATSPSTAVECMYSYRFCQECMNTLLVLPIDHNYSLLWPDPPALSSAAASSIWCQQHYFSLVPQPWLKSTEHEEFDCRPEYVTCIAIASSVQYYSTKNKVYTKFIAYVLLFCCVHIVIQDASHKSKIMRIVPGQWRIQGEIPGCHRSPLSV